MDANGRGMTQADLEALPEVHDTVLWQPDDLSPVSVIDTQGVAWMIGFVDGVLSKRRYGSNSGP